MESKQGLLMVAHGSDLAGSERELLQVTAAVQARLGLTVAEVGFLRTNESTASIAEAVLSCVRQGVTELLVMPYFLTAGFLQKKAVREVREALAPYSQVQLVVADPLGSHERLAEVVLDRIAQVAH